MIISLQTDFFNAEAGGLFHICFLHQEDTCVFKHPFIAKKSILWARAHMCVFHQRKSFSQEPRQISLVVRGFFYFLGGFQGMGVDA